MSLSSVSRLADHRDESHWFAEIARVEIEHFDSREMALAAEREAVIAERPLHNVITFKQARVQRDASAAAAAATRNAVPFSASDSSRRD
ncbi:MAG: hypothetical protein ACRD3J_30745, partial [Thermoanaerobaculia bacterium]